MISFLIPYRDRELHLENCILNIKKFYLDDYEILIGEQDDNLLFKKGQILNILAGLAEGDMLVLMDVDCRFHNKIHFYKLMDMYKKPFLPWYYRQECIEDEDGIITPIKKERYANGGFGGIFCFSKDQYLQLCGASNLTSGWGAEDCIIFLRTPYVRQQDDLYHIKHRSRPLEFEKGTNKNEAIKHNRKIWELTKTRSIDPQEDGINQTIAETHLFKTNGQVKYFKISNITVPDNFKYKQLLPKEY